MTFCRNAEIIRNSFTDSALHFVGIYEHGTQDMSLKKSRLEEEVKWPFRFPHEYPTEKEGAMETKRVNRPM